MGTPSLENWLPAGDDNNALLDPNHGAEYHGSSDYWRRSTFNPGHAGDDRGGDAQRRVEVWPALVLENGGMQISLPDFCHWKMPMLYSRLRLVILPLTVSRLLNALIDITDVNVVGSDRR